MPDFIAILAIYYACDASAAQYQLSASDAMRCSLTYEAIKVHFLTRTEIEDLAEAPGAERAQALRVGYRRFKEWEKANPELVGRIRPENGGG